MPITRNLRVRSDTDLRSVQRAFFSNAEYLPPRKNGVALYHEILSFSPDDRAQLTPAILTDLAGRYLELRAAEALAYGAVHMEKGHPHIHIVISGNLKRQKKKLHLSRPQFAGVKRKIEAYQKERYPQLTHSLVQLSADAARERKLERRRQQRARRQEKGVPTPDLTSVKEALDRAFLVSFSPDEFSRTLQVAGIGLICEQGRITGVTAAGTAYAFLQLGYPDNVLAKAETGWRIVERRMRTLASDSAKKTRMLLRRFGYAEELMAVLQDTGRDRFPPLVRERLTAIERDAEEKRRTYRLTHTGLGRRKEYSED